MPSPDPNIASANRRLARRFGFLVFFANILVIALALLLPQAKGNPNYHFQEFRLITLFSFIQLIATAWISWKTSQTRTSQVQPNSEKSFWQRPRFLWIILTVGFLFLAIDELISIHLLIRNVIHQMAGIKLSRETEWIGDLVMISYATAALGILCFYRSELKLFQTSWVPFAAAFVFLALTIFFDTELVYELIPIFPEFCTVALDGAGRNVSEESFKLFSECFFLIAVFNCLTEAKNLKSARHLPD
tara:strand:+ start:1531 stop:2268 length:738 start_codon:yes stop_codon:yes gene_type:complete